MALRIPRSTLISLLAITLVSCPKKHSTQPVNLSPEEVADRAKPATVLIFTEIEATAAVPDLSLDETTLELASQDELSPNDSTREKVRKVLNVLLSDPHRFFSQGTTMRTNKKKVYYTGSGFIFTPDGYIATNAHVVEPEDDDVKQALLESEVEWMKEDLAEVDDGISRLLPGSTMTDEAKERLLKMLASYYEKTAGISDEKRTISAILGYTGSGSDPTLIRKECEVEKVGKQIPGKDVAILKIKDDDKDLPTVSLAKTIDSAGVRTGSEVDIVGFPGEVTVVKDLSFSSRLEASQTTGHVSSIRDMTDGWRVIQTDTAMNPGNSGGPALNSHADVVGLATFQLKDGQGINFVVSVDVLNEFLNALSITPSRGAYMETYLAALDDLHSDHKERALGRFEKLQRQHPGIRIVEDFVRNLRGEGVVAVSSPVENTSSRRDAEGNTSQSPSRSSRPVLVFGGIALLVMVLLVAVVAANRQS